MKRALVTGGTGFIGRWVVQRLIEQGWAVRVFDMQPNSAALDDLLPGLSAQVEFVTGDIADGSVRAAAVGCDAIVHLVGVMTVDCARDPIRSAKINLIGSLQVFEAALAAGISRLSYLSTAGVFGPDDVTAPLPMSHYGAQKLAVEGAARAYFLDHGLGSTGFRPYIVYGPGQSSGIAAGPSIALAAAARGESATIRFSGRAGFVFVDDVAALLVAALDAETAAAEVYTLCGETAEMQGFIEQLREQAPDAAITVEGAPLRIAPDLASDELPESLAALPVTGLAQGISCTLDFYREREQRNVQL